MIWLYLYTILIKIWDLVKKVRITLVLYELNCFYKQNYWYNIYIFSAREVTNLVEKVRITIVKYKLGQNVWNLYSDRNVTSRGSQCSVEFDRVSEILYSDNVNWTTSDTRKTCVIFYHGFELVNTGRKPPKGQRIELLTRQSIDKYSRCYKTLRTKYFNTHIVIQGNCCYQLDLHYSLGH